MDFTRLRKKNVENGAWNSPVPEKHLLKMTPPKIETTFSTGC